VGRATDEVSAILVGVAECGRDYIDKLCVVGSNPTRPITKPECWQDYMSIFESRQSSSGFVLFYRSIAMELERYIVKTITAIPAKALELYLAGYHEQVPRAIIKHPKYGYAVIETSGQGPYPIWAEDEDLMMRWTHEQDKPI